MKALQTCPDCEGKGYKIRKNKGYPRFERVECERCEGRGLTRDE